MYHQYIGNIGLVWSGQIDVQVETQKKVNFRLILVGEMPGNEGNAWMVKYTDQPVGPKTWRIAVIVYQNLTCVS